MSRTTKTADDEKRGEEVAAADSPRDQEEVVAAVSPRSVGGTSLFEAKEPITADNVGAFRSDPADIAAASNELRTLGFRVLQLSPTTISIAGSRRLFEDVFSTKLRRATK